MGKRLHALNAWLLVLFILAPTINIVLIGGAGTGYLAIKDYLGTVWTMDDVEKIINYHYETTDGKIASLADYFWIVIDNDPENKKYNLSDFIASPLDGKTAVLPLPAGDHYVDIYWFGYHQRQLVHIVAGETYTLNLETAPVVPFPSAGEPHTSAEWGLGANPDGLAITRRDGKAYVLFNYEESSITVAWYDDDTGWNSQNLSVIIDTGYQYKFHITDPSNPEYYEERTDPFLWIFSWDVYKVKEIVKWNRTGEILHVAYIVAIAENEALLKGTLEFWDATAKTIVANAMQFIDPVTSTVLRVKAFTEYVQSVYDTYMGMVYSSKYQRTVLLIWDVFATPTQVVVLAHAYDVQQDGTVVKKPITSANAFTIDNRLVYVKQLSGGVQLLVNDLNTYSITKTWSHTQGFTREINIVPSDRVDAVGSNFYMPALNANVDDVSKYLANNWLVLQFKVNTLKGGIWYKLYLHVNITITLYDQNYADVFEQKLVYAQLKYIRRNNTFIFNKTFYAYDKVSDQLGSDPRQHTYNIIIFNDYEKIWELTPPAPATIGLLVTGHIDVRVYYVPSTTTPTKISFSMTNIHIMYTVNPKLEPPQVSLLKDGYQAVSGAFAVQVYTTLFREDSNAYLLGYYLLGNDPPPSFIIRDVHYDIENDLMHYVWTIITADAYGQDIVDMTSNTTTNANNETMYNYYLSIKPTVRTYDNVTLALFDYNRTAFLNLAPDIIQHLLAVPPNQGGYGTPIIDWSTVSVYSINFSRPYELYYYDRPSGLWVRVKTEYINDTMTWNILRYADNVQVETLELGDMSQHYYKLIYTDTNQTLKGWLYNDNGTLKFITGQVTWSLSDEELKKILEEIQLKGIYDRWQEQWNEIARKLGLITDFIGSLYNAWDWLGNNWKWIALGFGMLLVLIIVLIAGAGRGGRVVVVHR